MQSTPRRSPKWPLLIITCAGLLLFLHQGDAQTKLREHLFQPFQSSACSTPWLPTSTPPLNAQKIVCQAVPSNSSKFAIQLCSNSRACNQGYVQVNYLDTEECHHVEETMRASPVAAQAAYSKNELGPHTIAVLFDGAERFGTEKPSNYAGGCSYRYDYHLHNGGAFELKVILVYDDYRGLDALHQDQWQPIISLPLLAEPFRSDPAISCPQNCERYDSSSYTQDLEASQRVCDRDELITASWIPSFNSSLPLGEVINTGKFPPYKWIPHNCILEDTAINYKKPARNRSRCFGRRQQVLLTGDSHLRWLYDGLVQRLMGSLEGREGGEAIFGKAKEKDFKIGGLTVDYFTDPVLSSLRDDIVAGGRYADTTHVVVTAVQWLVHQPFHEYQQHINLLLRNIATFRSSDLFEPITRDSKPHFVWFNSPAWPHRSDEDVRSHNDTRTNARLKQMNDFASMRFSQEGFGVVDSFETSIAFCTNGESPDSAHFFATPVIEVMERLVAHRLDLCN